MAVVGIFCYMRRHITDGTLDDLKGSLIRNVLGYERFYRTRAGAPESVSFIYCYRSACVAAKWHMYANTLERNLHRNWAWCKDDSPTQPASAIGR